MTVKKSGLRTANEANVGWAPTELSHGARNALLYEAPVIVGATAFLLTVGGTHASATSSSLTQLYTAAPQVQVEGAPAEVDVCGETFRVEEEYGVWYLVHPQWSLLGSGRTREEARQSLLAEIAELARAMAADDPRHLSAEAIHLREFVLRAAQG